MKNRADVFSLDFPLLLYMRRTSGSTAGKESLSKAEAFFRRLTPRKVAHLYLSRYKSPTIAAAVSRSRFALSNALPTYSGRTREEGTQGINRDHKAGREADAFRTTRWKKAFVRDKFN